MLLISNYLHIVEGFSFKLMLFYLRYKYCVILVYNFFYFCTLKIVFYTLKSNRDFLIYLQLTKVLLPHTIEVTQVLLTLKQGDDICFQDTRDFVGIVFQ